MKANKLGITIILFFFIFVGFVIYFKDNDIVKTLGVIIVPSGMLIFAALTWINGIKNSQKNTFDSKFNLLLKQHNKQLEYVISFINEKFPNGKYHKDLIDDSNYMSPNNYLFNHFVFSPYMRVLYHILKSIEIDYGAIDKDVIAQKKYSSIVRSLIRNDILYLVAVNSLSDINADFKKYRDLLIKYDFFEHLNINTPMYQEYQGLTLKGFHRTVNDIKKEIELKIKDIVTVSLRSKSSLLCNMTTCKSMEEIYGDTLTIDTPTLYRLAFLYKEDDFLIYNKELKKGLRCQISKEYIYGVIDSLITNYSSCCKLYFGVRVFTKNGWEASKSDNRVINYNVELRKIKKNREGYDDFLERLANKHNVNKGDILFSRFSNSQKVLIDDYVEPLRFYNTALGFHSNTVIPKYRDEIYIDVVNYFVNCINSSRIMKDQHDMFIY